MIPLPPGSPLFPYTTLFRSPLWTVDPIVHTRSAHARRPADARVTHRGAASSQCAAPTEMQVHLECIDVNLHLGGGRSEEHTSELQSRGHLVCRLLLEKKKCT